MCFSFALVCSSIDFMGILHDNAQRIKASSRVAQALLELVHLLLHYCRAKHVHHPNIMVLNVAYQRHASIDDVQLSSKVVSRV